MGRTGLATRDEVRRWAAGVISSELSSLESSLERRLTVSDQQQPTKTLVLHIAVPDFWADDLDQSAAFIAEFRDREPTAEDRLEVVLEEWMRREVGITLVSLPGEKSMADDFVVGAFNGRVVGVEVIDR